MKFNLLDYEDSDVSYSHLFYKIVANVEDVVLLKMFISPSSQDSSSQ